MTKTFTAEVCQGALKHSESLEAFEGRVVRVSVDLIDAGRRSTEDDEAQPPEWMEVEEEFYVKMPMRCQHLVGVKIGNTSRMRPSRVVPEDLDND